MKNPGRIILILSLVLGIIAFYGISFAGGSLILVTPEVDMAKETKVKLKGTGFNPGDAVMILFYDQNGVPLDVGWALKPEPKADDNGEWKTTWNAKRYMQRKMIKAGEYTIAVTDAD